MIVSTLGFGSCKIQDQRSSSTDDMISAVSPQIAFINYSMVKDNVRGEYKVSMINMIIKEGKIKPGTLEFKTAANDDLEYLVLDENEKVLMRKYIENPLHKTFEYVSDDGLLAMKDIELDSAQFSLRIPLAPDARYVSVELFRGTDLENMKLSVVDLIKVE